MLYDVFDESKPHQCPFFNSNPETCRCSSCHMARDWAKSRAALNTAKAQNLGYGGSSVPVSRKAEVPEVPKETTRQKLQRQRQERLAESERAAQQRVEVPDFDLDEVLKNPELDGIQPVNIDPASMLVEGMIDTVTAAKEFAGNPSVGGAAMLAAAMIPGRVADKVADELPLKKLDSAMAKSLRTMKRFKVPCFKPGKALKSKNKGKERELESHFARQLKNQEAGLNDLTVGEYIENRNRYKKLKRAGTGLAQEDFREDFSDDLQSSLFKSYKGKMSPKEAKQKAAQRSREIMNDLAALHDPDMIAGGSDKVSRMGHKGVNSSIGSQWRNKARLAQMDEQAQAALDTLGPDAKMNVALERCPLNGKK